MAKYRKLPVVVEAIRLKDLDGDETKAIPSWVMQAIRDKTIEIKSYATYIQTLEGTLTVEEGDYIIRGIHGELYPCKPDIFEKTYEAVEE